MNNDFEEMRRLSIYIQESNPKEMLNISIKIIDGFMERLDANRTRNLVEVRNVYIFFLMYSLITRDLYFFPRIFDKIETVVAIFNDAVECATKCDRSVSPILYNQLNQFYFEQQSIFNISNFTIAKSMETKSRFYFAFDKSCTEVFYEFTMEQS